MRAAHRTSPEQLPPSATRGRDRLAVEQMLARLRRRAAVDVDGLLQILEATERDHSLGLVAAGLGQAPPVDGGAHLARCSCALRDGDLRRLAAAVRACESEHAALRAAARRGVR